MKKPHHETPPGFYRRHGPKGRVVFKPDETTQAIHSRELRNPLFKNVRFPDQFDCVRPHLSNRFFLKLDLGDAFDSVTEFRFEVMLDLSFGEFGRYYFHRHGGLIQGAPASPILFNLYCQEVLDKPLVRYCRKRNIAYTRYSDDMLFSCKGYAGWLKKWSRGIRDIIRKCGFRINERKTVFGDNKYIPVIYVGMRIHNKTVLPKEEFSQKLSRARKGAPTKSLKGLMDWNNRVLALNRENK